MATLNIGMKVNRAITATTTVNANSYAKVDYKCEPNGVHNQFGTSPQGSVITRVFGPGQNIPTTFNTSTTGYVDPTGWATISHAWTLLGGVEITNTI